MPAPDMDSRAHEGRLLVDCSLIARNGDTQTSWSYKHPVLETDQMESDDSIIMCTSPSSASLSGIFYFSQKFREVIEKQRVLSTHQLDQIEALLTPRSLRPRVPTLKEISGLKFIQQCDILDTHELLNTELRDYLHFLKKRSKIEAMSIRRDDKQQIDYATILKDIGITHESLKEHRFHILQRSLPNEKQLLRDLVTKLAQIPPPLQSQLFDQYLNSETIINEISTVFAKRDQDAQYAIDEHWEITIKILISQGEDSNQKPFNTIKIRSTSGNPFLIPWQVEFLRFVPPSNFPIVFDSYKTYSVELPLLLTEILQANTSPWWFSTEWWEDQMWQQADLRKFANQLVEKIL